MSKQKEMSEFEIASKIKAGSDFIVSTNRERKKALSAAKFLGCDLVTRAIPSGGFRIIIPSELPN